MKHKRMQIIYYLKRIFFWLCVYSFVLFKVSISIFRSSTSSPDVCSSLPFPLLLLRVCSHFIHLGVSLKREGGHRIQSRPRTSLGPCLRHQSYSRSETKEACVEIMGFLFFFVFCLQRDRKEQNGDSLDYQEESDIGSFLSL